MSALGIAGSLAGGIIEYLAEGAWTKRLHAGWAAQSGLRGGRHAPLSDTDIVTKYRDNLAFGGWGAEDAERARSGRGQWIRTSLLEAMVFMLDSQAARYLIGNEVPAQAGNDHPTSTPTGVYETSDGHINVAVGGQRMWQRFCQALDNAEMRDNPDYASNALRLAHRDRLTAEINAITRTRESASWIQCFTEAGVPSGEILSIDEVFAHPQVAHLGLAAPMDSAPRGLMRVVAQPVTLQRTPSRIASATPERGEHSNEILAELGFSASEISALREQSIV